MQFGLLCNTQEVADSTIIGKVEMAVLEQMQMQQSDFYHVGTYKHMPRLDKYINVLGDCVDKQYFSELNVIHFML